MPTPRCNSSSKAEIAQVVGRNDHLRWACDVVVHDELSVRTAHWLQYIFVVLMWLQWASNTF
jgi:hypothetical protein